jgi:hypothetical protein
MLAEALNPMIPLFDSFWKFEWQDRIRTFSKDTNISISISTPG